MSLRRSLVPRLGVVVLAVAASSLGAGCVVGTGPSSGYTASYARTTHPTIRIPRFNGRSGVIRIFNTTGTTLSRVTIGVRGFGCYGPTPTRTIIRTFDALLQPGYWRSYSFSLGYRCQRVRAATVGQ